MKIYIFIDGQRIYSQDMENGADSLNEKKDSTK